MNKIKSDTISQDKINSVLNQLREGTAFNIHTQSPVSFSFSSTSTGYEPMRIWIIFDPYPASEQQGIIYKFQINDQRYVFMFSNRYDGMRDLINNFFLYICVIRGEDLKIKTGNLKTFL